MASHTLNSKHFCGLLVAACALSFSSAHAGPRDDNVRIAVNVPYEPFEYHKPGGQREGFDIELGNALCEKAKLNCSWNEQAWDSLIPGLLARKNDAIMSAMTISAERRQQVLFSDTYLTQPSAWFAPADAKLTGADLKNLSGKRIGVLRGSMQDNYLTDLYGKRNEIKRYASADDAMLDLQSGRLDMVFSDYPTGKYSLLAPAENKGKFVQVGDKVMDAKYFDEGYGIAFRKRDTALAARFNDALKEVKRDGTYQKLVDKYFPDNQ